MSRLIVVVLILIVASCTTQKETKSLYPIDSLLNAQARYLSAKKASLKKFVTLDGKEQEILTTPKDDIAWQNELEIFNTLTIINKPTNISFYSVEDISDSRSNLKVKSFATKEDLPVKYIRVYYYQTPLRLRKLEASFNEFNSLYKSSRELTMDFQQIGDTTVLTSYFITGGQKMLLDDSVQYRISGSLTVLK